MKNQIKELIKESLIDSIYEIAVDEKKSSPLSPAEERVAKKYKPALAKFQKEYGEEKGKKYFYAYIRVRAKKK